MRQGKFKERVLRIVARIPRGSVLSYQEVAKRAGNPYAARAVGTIMAANENADIPCHRVIRSDGMPGGYRRGTKKKIEMLRKENALY